MITNNLAQLIKNLFLKGPFVEKAIDIVERLFDDVDEISKRNEEEENILSWKQIRKIHLFSQLLVDIEITFKCRLDDKLVRFLKRLIDSFKKRIEQRDLNDKEEQENFIIFIKIKNNFILYLKKVLL